VQQSASPVRAHCRSAKSSVIVGGNFGAPSKPPNCGSKRCVSDAAARASKLVAQRSRRARALVLDAYSSRICAPCARRCPAGCPRVRDAEQHATEARHAVAVVGGKYVPA
jgi:hypothetical protein